MRLSTGIKVGLVSLFTSVALLLGLLASTGIASAHTANTLQSVHISAIALANSQRRRNFEHESSVDAANDSATIGCPAGTVSKVTFDKGEAPTSAYADPNSDAPPTATIYYQQTIMGVYSESD